MHALSHNSDYPLTRLSHTCPLCSCRKPLTALVCWPCFNLHDMHNGDSALVKTLLWANEKELREMPRYYDLEPFHANLHD